MLSDPVWAKPFVQRPVQSQADDAKSNHAKNPDWDPVKGAGMRIALRAKFEQNPELAEVLLVTGDARLVEHSPADSYWGNGGDGSGLNRLGQLLMELRSNLQQAF